MAPVMAAMFGSVDMIFCCSALARQVAADWLIRLCMSAGMAARAAGMPARITDRNKAAKTAAAAQETRFANWFVGDVINPNSPHRSVEARTFSASLARV